MKNFLPLCFYPTKKIIVDDDQGFTQSLLLKFHGKNITDFNSPIEALEILKKHKQKLMLDEFLTSDDKADVELNQQILNFQLERLETLTHSANETDISVILVDYHMGEMTGIEFLKEIQHFSAKKILITSENDYRVAVDAFNKGLTDAYIRKDDPDFYDKIIQTMMELEWDYFVEFSKKIFPFLKGPLHYLNNENLINTFLTLCKKHRIVSFYLEDLSGNFSLTDIENNSKKFLLRNNEQLDHLTVIAREDGGSYQLIRQLDDKKTIPFFGKGNKFWEKPAKDWDKHLHEAHAITNEPDLYWSLI